MSDKDCSQCVHWHFSENNVDFVNWMWENHFDIIMKWRKEWNDVNGVKNKCTKCGKNL